MIILTIKTDQPEAEIGLFDGEQRLVSETWQAHRQLAETIHQKIEQLLQCQQKSWPDITGIVCFEGPGSFTGLRIGLTVGNALAYALNVPIVATGGENWQQTGIQKLQNGDNDQVALPKYGAPVHITTQKK